MKRVGATGALLGLPLAASNAAAADHDNRKAAEVPFLELRQGRKSHHTLFFNLSHLQGPHTAHYLYLGGRKYRLSAISDNPNVLAAARVGNRFLRAVPNDQITHHVAGVEIAEDAVALAYWTTDENTTTGTWKMTGMHVSIPPSASRFAFEQARMLTPKGPLPLSGKRRMYGVSPAQTMRDLHDETALVDTNSFAEAIVGLHPDVLSVDPASAAHIHANYISPEPSMPFLQAALKQLGPAAPEGTSNASGAAGWATLRPLIDDKTGQPFKKGGGTLNQYYPDWHPKVDQTMARSFLAIHPQVKDDIVLGIDVSGRNLNDPHDQPSDQNKVGKLWAHHDGLPTVVQKVSGAAADSGPSLQFTNRSAETGLDVSTPHFSRLPDGRITITLDNISNWFLRWLGVWVQFIDANGKVIPVNLLPTDTYPAEPGPYPRKQDKPDAIFLGVLPPVLAIMGIPVYPGNFSPTVNLPNKPPANASSMRVFYTGLGLSGSEPKDPVGIYDHGAAMTGVFNYGVVCFFMAIGSYKFSPVFKLVMSLGGGLVAAEIAALTGGVTNQASFAANLASSTMGFIKTLLTVGNSKIITELAAAITVDVLESEVEDSIPIAGQIARVVAAVVGAVQLAETSIEIAISPPAYVFDCVPTHDLSVTFLPAVNNSSFPVPPSPEYVVDYKVSYLFDNGTAHTQTVYNFNPIAKSLTVKFVGIPYGGQVTVSIGFYWRKKSGLEANAWCAGHATTPLADNTLDVIPPPNGLAGFQIVQVQVPIQSTTRYIHNRKTALDAQAKHLWVSDPDGKRAPSYVPPPNGQAKGLGDFGSITVRQYTAEQQGYVGYAWTAYSAGVLGCNVNANGQFDQVANLNITPGASAQDGYWNSISQRLCGYNYGVRIGYNLLSHKTLNMYLDTETLMIRPLSFDPPGASGPPGTRSFGMLNLDSTRCLLHPAGYVISINNASHKIEALKLPSAPVSNEDAAKFYVARTLSGLGTRPGLIISPIAAAISPDGAIVVLEAGNNRIQAFDTGGNSVPYFKNQAKNQWGDQQYFLELTATDGNTYLDLAVEFSGYLYVLSKDANNIHRLDIYHPDQTGTQPISTTLNLNAARITVDFWRSLYSLNYEVLTVNGNIPDFTEPSVSEWKPSLP